MPNTSLVGPLLHRRALPTALSLGMSAAALAGMGQASTAQSPSGQSETGQASTGQASTGQARTGQARSGSADPGRDVRTPGAASVGAAAQGAGRTNTKTGPLRPELRSLEQGTEDRGGFNASFRMPPLDLRVPTGFDAVYLVPGDEDGRMMRGSGALFAVFPQSAYRRTVFGTVPIAPADTVFHIGMPGGYTFPGGSLHHRASTIDPRIARRIDGRAPAGGEPGLLRATEGGVLAGPSVPADNDDLATVPVNPMPAIAEAPRAWRSDGRVKGQASIPASSPPATSVRTPVRGQASPSSRLASGASAASEAAARSGEVGDGSYADLELGPPVLHRD
jgi:hypothetical protein